jgi:hypothetical protein
MLLRITKAIIPTAVLIALCAIVPLQAQSVQLMPQLRLQPLSNTGTIQPNAVLYVFNAGTSTQASTYTDSTGIILNPNPIPADSSGRLPQVWLLNQFYKFQLCVQNDGAACASGDTLYTVDNVPGFGGGSSGSSSSPFISASPNPATSGILRLASGDSFCFRNNANNANLCFSKNTNDLFSWAGGSMLFPEVTAPSGVAASDLLYADNSAHRWAMSNNGGTVDTVVGRNSPDAFTNKTFDTGGSGNVFKINGQQITSLSNSGSGTLCASGTTGCNLTSPGLTTPTIGGVTISNVPQMFGTGFFCIGSCSLSNLPNSIIALFHTTSGSISVAAVRLAISGVAPSGCSTYAVFELFDETAGGAVSGSAITTAASTAQYNQAVGPTTIPTGHTFDIRESTNAVGCGNFPGAGTFTFEYTEN